MGWAEVVVEFLRFLKAPSGLGVFVLVILLAFSLYVGSLAAVVWTSWDNTNRLELAINSLGLRIERLANR